MICKSIKKSINMACYKLLSSFWDVTSHSSFWANSKNRSLNHIVKTVRQSIQNTKDLKKITCENSSNKSNNHKKNQDNHTNESTSYFSRNKKASTTAGITLLGTPILTDDLKEHHPVSEFIFLSGKGLGYLTERLFENEFGQSMMLGLFILSLSLTTFYFHGLTKHTVRQMQITQATKFGQIGHPYYTSRVIPQNPLLKSSNIN